MVSTNLILLFKEIKKEGFGYFKNDTVTVKFEGVKNLADVGKELNISATLSQDTIAYLRSMGHDTPFMGQVLGAVYKHIDGDKMATEALKSANLLDKVTLALAHNDRLLKSNLYNDFKEGYFIFNDEKYYTKTGELTEAEYKAIYTSNLVHAKAKALSDVLTDINAKKSEKTTIEQSILNNSL